MGGGGRRRLVGRSAEVKSIPYVKNGISQDLDSWYRFVYELASLTASMLNKYKNEC